jgi:sugar phosphate isomerase/epimerase
MILSAQTISTESFEDRVRAAAGADCSGIGIRPRDYGRARIAGLTDADMRAVLSEHAVEVVEHQALRKWAYPDDRGRTDEDDLWAIADALGGGYVIAITAEIPDTREAVAMRLAALAGRAAEHGLDVALEFLPWTDVPDAATAWELVAAADRPNVGVLVDAWHLFRGTGDLGQVRAIPADRIVAVHLADADAEVVGTLPEDTISRRRIPGEGALPLVELVRALDEIGSRPRYAVEVLSDEQRALPASDAARRAADGARRVLEGAR